MPKMKMSEPFERIKLVSGDITREKCDAIVNAANRSLFGGGGVDGAIHRAAGSRLLEECRRIREQLLPDGLPTGEAILTAGYDLPARFVIHTVGPVWHNGEQGESELLAACYRNVLRIAAERKFDTIAIPAISTGAYRFPLEKAAKIALEVIAQHLANNEFPRTVRCVLIGANYRIYEQLLNQMRSQSVR
ncbi:MAG TPA: O-acetyl-ADP-ribose deacetylase [Candidatus Marinimicrobia bacterium]|nr:O-acetyl-ADP-ribose deacetylase [Candidatus Neomarinimicrobiota bacterium]HRS52001.1 O-acetyl-ADP-ribose deacetylase [Candidatus Neomarinimicrobiota bacterium]HRU91870.1 O-acetyl-ADP-ribose deacetylase [Candidatus Neomarinimicrobiota bacterium]